MESKIEDLSCFPLSAGEWKNLYLLSRQQTVTGIVFQGIQHLPEHFLPAEELLVRWMAETDAIERKNIQMNKALELLVQWFTEAEFSLYYRRGKELPRYMRTLCYANVGDIDFYFDSGRCLKSFFSYPSVWLAGKGTSRSECDLRMEGSRSGASYVLAGFA